MRSMQIEPLNGFGLNHAEHWCYSDEKDGMTYAGAMTASTLAGGTLPSSLRQEKPLQEKLCPLWSP